MKKVVAIPPYRHKGIINFRQKACDAWEEIGGEVSPSHYPHRVFHGIVDRFEFPRLYERKNVAQLRFMQPINRRLDAFPECMTTEIIPLIWDCWPCLYDRMETWMRQYRVKTAIFTSSVEANDMQKRFPHMNILSITEGIDTRTYSTGKQLKERNIDLLEFGRTNERIINRQDLRDIQIYGNNIRHVRTKTGNTMMTETELFQSMEDAKITICVPRCMVDPVAGGVETLTQRYWEAMLSRIVIIGHAPQELINIIGYNPVIEIGGDPAGQIEEILCHIEDYQDFVDKNRETALAQGDWSIRMKDVQSWLTCLGYKI